MSNRGLPRWAPLAGAAFVVLVIVGFAMSGGSPDTDASNAKISAYLADHSNQVNNIASFFLALAAGLFLVAFYAVLRSRLVQAEGGFDRLGTVAFGAGIASAVLFVTAISAFVAPLLAANDVGSTRIDPGLYRITQAFGYELWVASGVVAALAIWSAAAVALRTRALPRWYAWLSIVVGVISLFAVFFIPIFVYWLWILVTAILLAMRPAVPAAPGDPQAATAIG